MTRRIKKRRKKNKHELCYGNKGHIDVWRFSQGISCCAFLYTWSWNTMLCHVGIVFAILFFLLFFLFFLKQQYMEQHCRTGPSSDRLMCVAKPATVCYRFPLKVSNSTQLTAESSKSGSVAKYMWHRGGGAELCALRFRFFFTSVLGTSDFLHQLSHAHTHTHRHTHTHSPVSVHVHVQVCFSPIATHSTCTVYCHVTTRPLITWRLWLSNIVRQRKPAHVRSNCFPGHQKNKQKH